MLATYPSWISDGSPIEDPFGHGERAVHFLRNLRHPKSKARGRAFQLDPWFERIVRAIYGPRHPDGTRVVKTVFCLIGRGNRKTTIGAALTLLHTIGPEKEPAGQVICAAADQKQARIAFEEAAGVVQQDRRLENLVDVLDYRNRIRNRRTGAILEAISADGATQHGRTPAFVLADELHAWKNRSLWEALRTGLVKTAGSLCVITTTAGRGDQNLAFSIYSYAQKVAAGEILDPAFLPILFEAPKDCDWRDEAVWHQVNPGLRYGYPDLEGLRQLAREAENRPADRESFRQLHLGIWLDNHVDPWIELETFDQGAGEIDLEALKGRACWIAVDMSTTTDLTAVEAAFHGEEHDEFVVLSFAFCPADNLRGRAERDGVPYITWSEEGHLTATEGNVVDYRAVEACIRDLCEIYDVREIAFDRALAQPVMAPLLDDGFPVVTMPLDPKSQAAGVSVLERAIIGGKLRHGGHPVLRWCVGNVRIYTGPSGLRTMHKGKLTDRIDLAFAAWMAVSRAAANDSARSIYTDTTARPEGLLFF